MSISNKHVVDLVGGGVRLDCNYFQVDGEWS